MTNIFETPAKMTSNLAEGVEPQPKTDATGFQKYNHSVKHVPAPVIGKKV